MKVVFVVLAIFAAFVVYVSAQDKAKEVLLIPFIHNRDDHSVVLVVQNEIK